MYIVKIRHYYSVLSCWPGTEHEICPFFVISHAFWGILTGGCMDGWIDE